MIFYEEATMKLRLLPGFLLFIAAVSISAHGAKPKSKWAKLDSYKIHYYDTGNTQLKDALVLIHGWACNAEFWKDSYNEFPNYRTITIDLPGHGRSDKPKLVYSIDHFARSVHAVLKQAGVRNVVLAGHSMGTAVARQFYRRYPKQTLGIVVVDGPLRQLAPKAEMDKFLASMRSNYTESSAKFVDGMMPAVKDKALAKFIRDNMLATPEHVGLSSREGMADERIWANDKIDVPVLAVMAPPTWNWQREVKETYMDLAPMLEFHQWTGVSHFLMMERPGEFNDLVNAFIVKNRLL
jgi:pimeloyl-ACP methyl ester carboxylesterase